MNQRWFTLFRNKANNVVRLEGAHANQICSYRAMGLCHAHITWTNVDPPLRGSRKRGIDGDYVYGDVDDDVEDRSSVGVCVQTIVQAFVYAWYRDVLILHYWKVSEQGLSLTPKISNNQLQLARAKLLEVVIIFTRTGGCMSTSPSKVLLVNPTIGGRWEGAGPRTCKGLDLVLWILVYGPGRSIELVKGPVGPSDKP